MNAGVTLDSQVRLVSVPHVQMIAPGTEFVYLSNQMARMSNALPLAPDTYYEGSEVHHMGRGQIVWLCMWILPGLWVWEREKRKSQSGLVQIVALRHCPSADDPRTLAVETNCHNKTAAGSLYAGEEGNLCHVDCANRGVCDFKTGQCKKCFDGQYGVDCSVTNPNAAYVYWDSVYHQGSQTIAV